MEILQAFAKISIEVQKQVQKKENESIWDKLKEETPQIPIIPELTPPKEYEWAKEQDWSAKQKPRSKL